VTTSDYIRDARVAVIGAGAIGSVLAYRLAQAGAAVTVIDRAPPGSGTTGRTFAWLNGIDKPPRPYHRMSIMAIRDQEDLADELGGDWVHVTGSLHWTDRRDTGRAAALEESVRQLRGWGMRVDRATPEHVRRDLEPDLVLDPDQVSAVYLVPRSGWLEPARLVAGALGGAREQYGATIVRGDVAALPVSAGMVERVVLADGQVIEADLVVNAAGPDGGRVAALAGSSLPLERTPGILLVTEPVAARLKRVAYGPGIHLRPDGGGRVMVQWEPLDSLAVEGAPPAADAAPVREAMERAAAVLPALAGAAVESVRLGIRAMPRDGYPLAGFDAAVGNLYHVVTHSGITLAARLALLITEELTGGDATELESYRPGRSGSAFARGHGTAE
jgi:glycine/D-amino acid oxidase-like deaminating enzyme